MKNPYRQAHYWLSADKLSQLPEDSGLEVAFAGRSNSGKSSAINTITQQNALARTSKTPGRTQQINFFRLDDEHRLVDLPGYGYAKVSEEVKLKWQNTVENYLSHRQSLAGVVLTMDIRHPMKAVDEQMIAWCAQVNMPLHILLTKSDKLKRAGVAQALQKVQQMLQDYAFEHSVQAFSALKKSGVEEALGVLNRWMQLDTL
ncbi:MAG: ribosome biogenesis GTP-binding protein YihA/YsxC [Gammaproteobacteria bacterium]|jgi:GTP-binding protein|nr:ribosome biogenesis GTP-binding protein YihA/YsxC [Gammaproteobacteria bacterium]